MTILYIDINRDGQGTLFKCMYSSRGNVSHELLQSPDGCSNKRFTLR